MITKRRTPGEYPGASKTCQSWGARQAKYPTKPSENQEVPAPGTALTAFLKKYHDELYPYRHHEHGQRLLTAILVLLNEAER